MTFRLTRCIAVGMVCLLAAEAPSIPDDFTAGFYTQNSDEAFYVDQSGVSDPFYIPAKEASFLPRVSLVATRDDNYNMSGQNQQSSTSVSLFPGFLMVYGHPKRNYLYVDTGMRVPVYQSISSEDDGSTYMITAGGIYKTGKGRIYGRLGHRRIEIADPIAGARVVNQDYIGDVGIERDISSKTTLGLNGSVVLHNFGDDKYINFNRYYGAGRFYHPMTAKSQWFLQGGVGRDELERSVPGVNGSATFNDLSMGMRGDLTPKTSVSGRLGYRWRQSDDATIGDTASWIANLGVKTTPFGLSTFSANLLADISPDITAAGDSTVDRRLIVGVQRRLFTDKLKGDASVLAGMTDRFGLGITSKDEYWGYNLGVVWATRWDVSFGASYSYIERWSVSGGASAYASGLWSLRMSWNY